MKLKLLNALKEGHKNLGLSDDAFERVATFGETFITSDEQIKAFVDAATPMLKAEQSAADKVRTELNAKLKAVEGEKADLLAKLNNGVEQSEETIASKVDQPDMAKTIADAIAAAISPLRDELATFKADKAISETVNTVNARIDSWGYGKGYPKEMEKARKNAMELYEAYGKTWSADELEAKIKEKFNQEVFDRGIDTSKPFDSDGASEKAIDFSNEIEVLRSAGIDLPE